MTEDTVNDIRRSLYLAIKIEEKGINKNMVHTGFTYPDGDELHIILKKQDGQWYLTDEGHTFMWLSYDEINVDSPRIKDILARIMATNQAELWEREISVKIKQNGAGIALTSMITALIQTADLCYINKAITEETQLKNRRPWRNNSLFGGPRPEPARKPRQSTQTFASRKNKKK